MDQALKWRPELSYTATPTGKCSLDVSPEENNNGFSEQAAGSCPQRKLVNREQEERTDGLRRRDEMGRKSLWLFRFWCPHCIPPAETG